MKTTKHRAASWFVYVSTSADSSNTTFTLRLVSRPRELFVAFCGLKTRLLHYYAELPFMGVMSRKARDRSVHRLAGNKQAEILQFFLNNVSPTIWVRSREKKGNNQTSYLSTLLSDGTCLATHWSRNLSVIPIQHCALRASNTIPSRNAPSRNHAIHLP